uniref:Uncharacterized protein n=1 Tax=Lepeophtheirus salmonis TaxID=72036 RepID=A0A0K2UII5_LEPSM
MLKNLSSDHTELLVRHKRGVQPGVVLMKHESSSILVSFCIQPSANGSKRSIDVHLLGDAMTTNMTVYLDIFCDLLTFRQQACVVHHLPILHQYGIVLTTVVQH